MKISLFPSSNTQNILSDGHWFTRISVVRIPDGLPQFDSFRKLVPFTDLWRSNWRLCTLERVKICYKWFDGKHVQQFHVSLVAVCAQMNKKYFPNLSPRLMQFQATTLKLWVNITINQWENQLNWIVTTRHVTRLHTESGSLFFCYWGTHKCILVTHVGLVN